jgi:hypothetical protein
VRLVLKTFIVAALTAVFAIAALSAQTSRTPESTPQAARSQSALIKQYCAATCHSDQMKRGGVTLAGFDASRPEQRADVAEKMIRKLRAGMMPPPDAKRPDPAAIVALVTSLETRIDQQAARQPNPGWRPFQRLNRAEYARAVHDLLDLDVDTNAYLPPDTISSGFDNVADVQTFSPTLMEGYLRAASAISRLAVGDRNATPTAVTYRLSRTTSQMRHVEGTPFGTRGGISAVHTFAADGEYVIKIMFFGGPTSELFGYTTIGSTHKGEQLEVSLNGERVSLFDIKPQMSESDPQGLSLETPPIHIKAGPQRISAAFILRYAGPVDDLLAPIEYTYADARIGTGFGVTTLPHVRDITIKGPSKVTGVSNTPSRRRIFTCRPTMAGDEGACAADIVRRLTSQAYRGRVSPQDFEDVMRLYEQGRNEGGFESGIRLALQTILANPRFLFRVEQAPASLKAGQTYRLSDPELAARLSFFLWGTVPDRELVHAAIEGTLKTPAVLEKQVRRMLADRRSEALATRFAGQWLRLQDVEKIRPDSLLYPYWDYSLAESLQHETERFFDSLVREDRSVLDLLTADYTFVNERVARHYGIPNVAGNEFRRVALPDDNRRGILGHGSILLLTSVADRTSPVQRGKWILEVLLGSPPPPPPPNVPDLDETRSVSGARLLSVRERMEQHRANPACTSCHRVMDPLGLALENFDVTGRWRIKDSGVPVDATGELYDGFKIDGPVGLRQALLKHSDMVLLSFTESLMTYALGRRVEHYDMPTIRTIIRDAAKTDNRLSSFILGVVRSAAFQMSRAETTDQM